MKRINSLLELQELKDRVSKRLSAYEKAVQVKVHLGTCGISSGADKTLAAFEREISKLNLSGVIIRKATCIGLCAQEPIVTIIDPELGTVIYHSLTEDKVSRVVEEHLNARQIIKKWTVDVNSPRFKLQEIRILHNQDIDPESIDEYIARGGYIALGKAVSKMTPDEVLKVVKDSGLKGRGGAGFPAATKWGFVRNAKGTEKYVICNGDEGDPGAYMNRAVLEGNPHSVIEGMAIGAFGIGNVRQGFAYVRAEYPLAIKTLQNAISQAKSYGLLGENILGSGFSFDLEIFPGAGAFVCGEETALITSIEGNRGTPRQRPPFPANEGLFGKPTTLNNVETWSNVPQIVLNGAEWFNAVGSKNNKGTKTLCLVGKVKNAGLIEVPLGTSLGKIIFDLGGGIQNDKKFKGVQLGGPSGGVIPAAHLNTPVDYDSIPPLGAIMGSGGMVVMDEDSCMVDVAKYFLEFTKDESCGKCISCREGSAKMYGILCKITGGTATLEDLNTLEELSDVIKSASLCSLGQTVPNPVLTTLKYFRDEYEAHIIDGKCPAAVCQALFTASCQHTCPVGLNVPGYISLIKEQKFEQAYRMIMQRLPFPMTIGRICPAHCRDKCRRSQVDDSVQIRALKRFAADYAFEHNFEYLPEIKENKAEKVAIIGAGPAGLSAAWDLAIEGYPVTVFDALPVAGGMLAVGIPEYRLPRLMLNREIENIKNIGVNIELNTRVENAPALLNKGFKAVLVAVGTHEGLSAGVAGEDLNGVVKSVNYLRDIALGKNEIPTGKKVVVIGGGNSAIDAARTALRKGAEQVSIVYRRGKEDMPAEPEEIEAALKEGITLNCWTNPVRITGANGHVDDIECAGMSAGDFDSSGRRQPVKIPGSEFILQTDMVIAATGQQPDLAGLLPDNVTTKAGNRITADRRTLSTPLEGVFAAGDAFLGASTAIEAIASGQRAASSIKRFLMGKPLTPRIERNHQENIIFSSQLPEESQTLPREPVTPSEISLKERKQNFKEVVKGYTSEQAVEEAGRCLRCDLSSD